MKRVQNLSAVSGDGGGFGLLGLNFVSFPASEHPPTADVHFGKQ